MSYFTSIYMLTTVHRYEHAVSTDTAPYCTILSDVITALHYNRYEHAVSTIWALDGDFTEERGATRAVPGSHVWPRAREAQPEESVPASIKSLPHNGPA